MKRKNLRHNAGTADGALEGVQQNTERETQRIEKEVQRMTFNQLVFYCLIHGYNYKNIHIT